MSSSEEGRPIVSEGTTLQKIKVQRTRVLIGVLAALLVVAAVGICAAAVLQGSHRNDAVVVARHAEDMNLESTIDSELMNKEDKEDSELSNKEEEEDTLEKRSAYTGTPSPVTHPAASFTQDQILGTQPVSCLSSNTSKRIAAAHIKGYLQIPFEQSTRESSRSPYPPPGYQQRWQCSDYRNNKWQKRVHAYVDGGMWFNQTDKSLYVPTCGYYYVYSQITFKCRPLSTSITVYHRFKFNRNCPDWLDPVPLDIQGMSTIGPFTAGTQAGTATTYTGDIVKMCQGGRMWVEIPDGPNGVPCPPFGDEQSTFMGAILIANTTCHWPPEMTLTNLNN